MSQQVCTLYSTSKCKKPSKALNVTASKSNSGSGIVASTGSQSSIEKTSPHNKSPNVKLSPIPVANNQVLLRAFLSSLSKPALQRLFLLHKILLLNDGRDKVLKVVQYFTKFILWKWLVVAENDQKRTRLNALVSQCSITRKMVRLLHCLDPLDNIVSFFQKENGFQVLFNPSKLSQPLSATERRMKILGLVNHSICFFQDIIDDLICLAKVGALDKRWTQKATLSDRLWFITIHLDMLENLVNANKMRAKLVQAKQQQSEQESKGKLSIAQSFQQSYSSDAIRVLKEKLFMQNVSMIKLLCDYVFCFYDVFSLDQKGYSSGWQTVSALMAAILGTFKIAKKL